MALPVISSLASLAELASRISAANDVCETAAIVRGAVKWLLPVDDTFVLLRDDAGSFLSYPGGVPFSMPSVFTQALACRATVTSRCERGPVIALPLVDRQDAFGLLVLRVPEPSVLETIDRGMCHLLALNVASALRSQRLIASERAARIEAEAAIQTRDAMVHAVTHDLRNPLGVVMALVSMTTDAHPEAFLPGDIDDLDRSLLRMRLLIDELLEVAHVEKSGQLPLRRAPCDLRPLVEEAVRGGQSLGEHRFVVELDRASLAGSFDESRIVRVLGNMISNAVKYSPAGGDIHVRARRGDMFEISVEDHGIGIPVVDLGRLFERFRRAGNVGKIRGTGIGLASSREIARHHGGDLVVRSVEGKGSTFTLRLPLA